jgi:hypothetical protein
VRLVSISTMDLRQAGLGEQDLYIAACGYESRAIHVSRIFGISAKRKIALAFDLQQDLNYAANLRWFKEDNFQVEALPDFAVGEWIQGIITELAHQSRCPNVTIDISCLNRFRLAQIISGIRALNVEKAIFTFVYNVAEYDAPSEEVAPTSIAEPVTPEFAGWSTAPERPPAAILGLGYEQSRAIGIIDHLEINNASWAFIPVSPVTEYLRGVEQANKSLLETILAQGRAIKYDVLDPASLFRELNTLVVALKDLYNPILIPLGPKIFALCALLAATLHEELGVWRVSSGILDIPIDRRPSPHTTAVRTTFERTHTS